MTATIEPSGYIATIPGPNGTRICVGPFEDRIAALDLCARFAERVTVESPSLMIGPMYAPAEILSLAYDVHDEYRQGEKRNDD